MEKYFFWNHWNQPFKWIATFLFMVLVVLIVFSLAIIAIGPEGLIGWHTFSQKYAIDIISQTVDVGPFSFPFHEQLFVIKEFVSGGQLPSVVWVQQLNLVIVFTSFALILTLLSFFNRFWFLAFTGLVFTFIIFLHPEMVQVAVLGDKWLLGLIFLFFVGPAYYFQSFNKDVSFTARFISFILITVGFLGFIVWQAEVVAPLHALMSYGILAPYFVVLLFVLMVGHEIVNSFIMAIAGSEEKDEDNNRIKHFLVLTLIYLANVLLAYLKITHVIDWDIFILNPFVLLGFAAVIGVWGMKYRYVLYKKVEPNQPTWVLFYLIVAVMSYSTIIYLMLSMEDPMLKIIGDFVIYTQLSLGTAFLLYILYNFIQVIEQGYSIKDILYKPQNLPHMTYRLVGIVILTAIVFMKDIKYPIWYSYGGYYNSVADYFYENNDTETAQVLYAKGADLSFKNHKSNYKLGMMLIDSDHEKAIDYFRIASSRIPSPQAFVNEANLESDQGRYFDALFTLQKGQKELSNSVQIQNNLGLQFSKANVLDSAWYYYQQASSSDVAKNNALAFVVENNFILSETDSAHLFDNLNNVGIANAAALGRKPDMLEIESGDNMIASSLLNNMLVNGLVPFSYSAYQSINKVVDSTKNSEFSEELNYALALYELRNEHVTNALIRLQKLAMLGSDKQFTYYQTLGLINLMHQGYTEAETFFYLANQASGNRNKMVLPQLALAQTEAGFFEDALITWKSVENGADSQLALKASVMGQVIKSILNENDSIVGDDLSLYLKARYQRLWVDEFSVKATFDKIKEKTLKNQLALDLATYYFEAGNLPATKLFYDIINPEIGSEIILRPLLYLNIRFAYAGIVPDVKKQLQLFYDAGFTFESNEQLQKLFFEINPNDRSLEFAEKLASQNPFFVEGVIWAAQYFDKDADEYRSYNIVQEALDKNPDSRLLIEEYCLRAVDLGLEEYANKALLHYRELYHGEQFNNFVRKLNERKALFNTMLDDDEPFVE